MKSTLNHIQLNVSGKKSLEFYKDMLTFLGFRMLLEGDWGLGMENEDFSVWVMLSQKEHAIKGYHRKRIGINHIAFKVSSKKAVNTFAEKFLKPRNITTLYSTPKHFPEYTKKYYAVFFEDPDRIKLEVVHL